MLESGDDVYFDSIYLERDRARSFGDFEAD
jgi:hypothetical protein